MTATSDARFSQKLTASLLTHNTGSTASLISQSTPSPPHSNTPKPTHSPTPNAISVQARDSNVSFNNYLGKQFKHDAPVFINRLPITTHTSPPKTNEPAPWIYDTSKEDTKNWKTEQDSMYHSERISLITSTPTFFSIGAYLFLFGFLCPPCWWIGSFCPATPKDRNKRRLDHNMRMALRWRLLNRYFSLGFSVILIITFIVLAIVYAKFD